MTRVEFVTTGKGEDSLHFMIKNGVLADVLGVCLSSFRHTKDDIYSS